ncbi:HTH-type transcriptional regulator CymR [Pontiella desulfatans]|uniref:HTH-type transcriptional regulator CymR n=1 Tax=Pontiella desulfatans TaxID=2750659 RepID=A0A6C2TXQ4_PONDE|nr:Rrf2 family transcriptional regulator [Pontiella desulfatans]VGO12121.1 HTH-type transcriptional regulator CymR [Pontiella desulfatans]
MKLSTKPRYGLRILAQIAADGGDASPVSGKEVARKQGISIAYIEQILIPMRNAGLVRTVRGRNGGYMLDRPSAEITLLEIIELFEGKLELVSDHDTNTATEIWNRLTHSLRKQTGAITVADLAELISAENPPIIDFMI